MHIEKITGEKEYRNIMLQDSTCDELGDGMTAHTVKCGESGHVLINWHLIVKLTYGYMNSIQDQFFFRHLVTNCINVLIFLFSTVGTVSS